ncbi:glutathione-dependent disulfide-bond oxidoreductase [Streptococcus porcinus]|uniref:Glutathione S-transferase, C-terminal domain protein n=1 Tax=Streptococcus porcinus str. Jelinkova 176 TaxID=873448 RepID=A0ABN0CW46_STRPO|nr:glutathione-dependent disulfide-bond oxidoreductase [Streptococcus porcinus]EGJ27440.1 glutathione S-transferase, C-terminal domain protein [Streptococcus porcinus str. Jelinkova 176]SQG44590.1 glutathione S-transferase [Streptococcus porcinus]
MSEYQLPTVWENTAKETDNNQPTAGSRFKQVIPKGNAPFQLYTLGTPNGIKPLIMLEELKELGIEESQYDAFKIKIDQGQQFGSDFVAINPNSKIPALVDQSTEKSIRIFESANILLYLADKFQSLISSDWSTRTETLNWLFWQTGAAPFVGGGFGHFFHYAPEKLQYPINRYTMETKRQLDLLDRELASKDYIVGNEYSIADIAIWSWYGQLALDDLYKDAGTFLDVTEYQNLQAWARRISKRPAVKRALACQLTDIN